MKLKHYIHYLAISAAGVLFCMTASAQSSYIGLNKTADYDYASRTGVITLDSFVKGSTKIIRAAKNLDAILVLDYSGSMSSSYSTSSSATQFKKYKKASITTKLWSDFTSSTTYGTEIDTQKNLIIGGTSRRIYAVLAGVPSGITNPSNSRKWLYYKVGSDKYYLQPCGVARKAASSTLPGFNSWPVDTDGRKINPVERTADVVWTEMSYTDADITKRIHALKAGVCNFIDSVYVHNTDKNEKHELSIIQFNSAGWPKFDYGNASDRAKYIDSTSDIYLREMLWYSNCNNQDYSSGGTSVLMKFNPLTSEDRRKEAKQTLDTYEVNGNTAGDAGLQLARLLNSSRTAHSDTSKYAKTIVFFTDGQPNKSAGSTFDETAANEALAEARLLKQAGFIIYTIYCGNLSGDVAAKTKNYVNYLSSNYPNAQSMSSPGTAKADKYAKDASDNLVEIFSSIAGEVMASAGVQYGTETVMNDFINNAYFKLSSTVDVSNPWASIDVFKVKCTGMTLPDSTRTFSTDPADTVRLTSADGIQLLLSRASSSGEQNDRISVRGFDYSANWCGTQKNGDPHGWKLIVKVPFEFTGDEEDPVPGTVATNEDGSGIYPAERDEKGEIKRDEHGNPIYNDEPEEEYVSPTIIFCRLKITRYGLDKGESAIYEVTKGGTFVARVSLNGTESESVFKILYGLPGGEYTVTETGWNWAYYKDPACGYITQQVDNPDSTEPVNFVFRGAHKTGTGPEDLHNHDEEYKVNIINVSDL